MKAMWPEHERHMSQKILLGWLAWPGKCLMCQHHSMCVHLKAGSLKGKVLYSEGPFLGKYIWIAVLDCLQNFTIIYTSEHLFIRQLKRDENQCIQLTKREKKKSSFHSAIPVPRVWSFSELRLNRCHFSPIRKVTVIMPISQKKKGVQVAVMQTLLQKCPSSPHD